MMFSLKHTLLLGLVAVSAAQPADLLSRQAGKKIPDPLECDGEEWSKTQIYNSIEQAKALKNSHYAYPKKFENNENIYNTKSELKEFPLLDPVWINGVDPGTFRVIMKDWKYFGVTNKDVGTGGSVHKC
ncbi:hypothetical protein F4861DRAFT_518363 [Xylaria intraflava]|nr:hypothetical protein F4861DRAFT_518363 [Xylaria intraflava]